MLEGLLAAHRRYDELSAQLSQPDAAADGHHGGRYGVVGAVYGYGCVARRALSGGAEVDGSKRTLTFSPSMTLSKTNVRNT